MGTPIYYNPYYGDPQNGTPNSGKPPTVSTKEGARFPSASACLTGLLALATTNLNLVQKTQLGGSRNFVSRQFMQEPTRT